jgi:hypothetical protein
VVDNNRWIRHAFRIPNVLTYYMLSFRPLA